MFDLFVNIAKISAYPALASGGLVGCLKISCVISQTKFLGKKVRCIYPEVFIMVLLRITPRTSVTITSIYVLVY